MIRRQGVPMLRDDRAQVDAEADEGAVASFVSEPYLPVSAAAHDHWRRSSPASAYGT